MSYCLCSLVTIWVIWLVTRAAAACCRNSKIKVMHGVLPQRHCWVSAIGKHAAVCCFSLLRLVTCRHLLYKCDSRVVTVPSKSNQSAVRLVGVIMFSTWPSVCPSVHPSVHLSVCPFICYQSCEHEILKTNKSILLQIGTWSTGQGDETVNISIMRSKVIRCWSYAWRRGRGIIFDPFGGVGFLV